MSNCKHDYYPDFVITCTNCGTTNCDECAKLEGEWVDCELCGVHYNYHCRDCGELIREFGD